MNLLYAIALAFLLDQLLGDPAGWPHPVRWIGRAIEFLEALLRRLQMDRLAGVLLVLLVTSVTGLAVWGLLQLAIRLHPAVHFAITVLLIYWGLAARGLARHARAVLEPLEKGDLILARQQLALMVGRDTEHLSSEEITAACVESVAENTTDGIVAPLFYVAIGGPIALWVYKAINTLDSMVGYRNPRYVRFGWAAARLDDLANWIPARLMMLLMPLAAVLSGQAGWRALQIAWRDGGRHPSPNAGLAEAAMAGALGVRLGGPSTYGGTLSNKPYLGEPREHLKPVKIRQAVKVMLATSWLMLLVACGIALAVDMLIKEASISLQPW